MGRIPMPMTPYPVDGRVLGGRLDADTQTVKAADIKTDLLTLWWGFPVYLWILLGAGGIAAWVVGWR